MYDYYLGVIKQPVYENNSQLWALLNEVWEIIVEDEIKCVLQNVYWCEMCSNMEGVHFQWLL
jgi:hypothetical protein